MIEHLAMPPQPLCQHEQWLARWGKEGVEHDPCTSEAVPGMTLCSYHLELRFSSADRFTVESRP